MAVSVRNVRSSGTGGTATTTTHNVPIPTCVVGDDLWASFTLNGGHGTVTDPSGWTRIFPTTVTDDGFMSLLVYRKTATATEVAGGNITVVSGTAVRADYGSISLINADTSLPPDGVQTFTTTAGSTSVSQTVTASADDSLILSILALDSASENATPTAPLVQQWDPVEVPTLGQVNAGATVYSATAGATTCTWTWTSSIARKHWAAAIRGNAMVVADAAQTQTSDVVALAQVHTLTVDAAVEPQTSDVVALVQVQTITTVNAAAQTQTSDVPALVQVPTLAVADAAQTQTSTVPALSQLQTITTVNAAVQVVTSDVVGLFKAATGTMSASPSTVPSMTSGTAVRYTDRVAYADTGYIGPATTKATPAVSWEAGDLIVAVGGTGAESSFISTVSAPGLTFTAGTPIVATNFCWANYWTAVAQQPGSAAITATRDGSNQSWGLSTWVFRNLAGIGAVATGNAVNLLSLPLTRTHASSRVVEILLDWNALSPSGLVWTPAAGVTPDVVVQHAVAGGYTVYVADWADQGPVGTTAYGVSGVTGKFTNIALEILSGAGSSMASTGTGPTMTGG